MSWTSVDRTRNRVDLFGTQGDECRVHVHALTPGLDWTAADWAGQVRLDGVAVADWAVVDDSSGAGSLDLTMKLTPIESELVVADVEHQWSIRNLNDTKTEVVSGLMVTEAATTS